MRNKSVEYVSAQDFADAIKKIKAEKGLTWEEMGNRAGRAPGTIASYAFGNRERIEKTTSEDILLRLSGARLEPTARQQAEYTAMARKMQTDQRSETLQSKKLDQRKAIVAELRASVRQVCLD